MERKLKNPKPNHERRSQMKDGLRVKRYQSLLLVLALLLSVGCAGLQANWNKLTPDERARVILRGFQKQLDNAFDTTKAFVATNPAKYQVDWKLKVVPAFDVANGAIRAATTAKYAPERVYDEVLPFLNKALTLARGLGAKI
jgi:hypothetical protein